MLAARRFPALFEVVGFAEDNEKRVEKRGNLPGYADLKRMSVDEVIEKSDALLIETDVWDLTATAQKCIDAGRHIHMDKPASGTLAEYKHLLDTAKEKELVVQLAYMYRYNPAVQECMRRIKDGRLGEIKPSVYKVLPIEDAMAAHAILQNGENGGKVVLSVCEE